jgi:hypothetical protein
MKEWKSFCKALMIADLKAGSPGAWASCPCMAGGTPAFPELLVFIAQ